MSAPVGFLLAIVGFVVVVGPLVFLHELGHYLAGRACGVDVESFSIGMGREIVGWNDRRGTRWKLSALPIGGYVKFAGDMGPASTPSPEWLRLSPEKRARTFQGRPLWQRFLIVAAGPVTNFLLAIAVFIGFFAAYGVPYTPPTVAAVVRGSAADAAGLRVGDRISSIGGRRVGQFDDLVDYVQLRPGQAVIVTVLREGRLVSLPITIGAAIAKDPAGSPVRIGRLGVAPDRPMFVRAGPIRTVASAVDYTAAQVRKIADGLGQILTGQHSVKELGGPIRIARYSAAQVSLGALDVIGFMALISINLGFINLLPIPMLDGGHLLFYVVEGIRRKPLPERAQEWAFRTGLALLLTFMVLVTINDLGSVGVWHRLAGLIG